MSDTPYRYTAELAEQIELAWQDRWAERGHVPRAQPGRALGRPGAVVAGPARSCSCSTCSPTPAAPGLHVGHPLGYIATDVVARFHRMTRQERPALPGLRRVRPARRAVRRADRPAPAQDHRGQHRHHGAPAAPPGPGPRRPPHHRDDRPGVLPLDAVDLPADLQLLVRRGCRAPRRRAAAAPGRSPSCRGRTAVGRAPARRTAGRGSTSPTAERRAHPRRPAAGLHQPRRRSTGAPGLGTVLSNEEVTNDGRSERGNFPVFKRNLRQWMMRITAYADRLADDLDRVDWPEKVKLMQRNWIGRSARGQGLLPRRRWPTARVAPIEVFTTRPDTLFGATFMVLAPEHPLVDALVPQGGWPEGTKDAWTGGAATPEEAVAAYRRAASRKSDVERQSEGKDKTGVFTGGWATNPVNGARVPVFVADYVLMGYGTGAIMAVPGQDERDWDFADEVRPADHPHRAADRRPPRGPGVHRRRRRRSTRANDEISLDGLRRRRGQGDDHRLAAGQGPRRADDHLQAARLAVQPAALLGRAVPDRLRRGRRRPRRARVDAAASSCRRCPTTRPKTFDPDDASSRARAAAVAGRRSG